MRKKILILALMIGLGCAVSQKGFAGDEDQKENAQKAAPKEPNPETPAAEPPSVEPEPDMSLGEEQSPEFKQVPATSAAAPLVRTKKKKALERKDPDLNIDYTEALNRVDLITLPRGVLPPALGFRGYRPNMLALSVGDRTPGVGGLVEYSWNRIGVGVYLSVRRINDPNAAANASTGTGSGSGKLNQFFYGAYGLYRWLPFDISPYFLMGIEGAKQTDEAYGGIAGAGVESRIYQGWTILLGYTYHSTAHKGFIGGSLGWSF